MEECNRRTFLKKVAGGVVAVLVGLSMLAPQSAYAQSKVIPVESILTFLTPLGDGRLVQNLGLLPVLAGPDETGRVVALIEVEAPGSDLALRRDGKWVSIARRGEDIGGLQVEQFRAAWFPDPVGVVFLATGRYGRTVLAWWDGIRITPIWVSARSDQGFAWPKDADVVAPVAVGPKQIAFSVAGFWYAGWGCQASYVFDPAAPAPSRLDRPGASPATGLLFEDRNIQWAPPDGGPSMNRRGDLAFLGNLADRRGPGVFMRKANGDTLPIAVRGTFAADGRRVDWASTPRLTNDGRLLLFVYRHGDGDPWASFWSAKPSVYVYQGGELRPLFTTDADPSLAITNMWPIDNQADVLIEARDPAGKSPGLFLVGQGGVKPVAVPAKTVVEGGTIESVHGLSDPSEGERILYATLRSTEGPSVPAVFRVGQDGKLSLVLKQGSVTTLGTVMSIEIGDWIDRDRLRTRSAPNIRGEVALSVILNNNGRTQNHVVLVRPTGAE